MAARDMEGDRRAVLARWMVTGLGERREAGWRSGCTNEGCNEGCGWQIERGVSDFLWWRTSDLVAVLHPSKLRVKIRRG